MICWKYSKIRVVGLIRLISSLSNVSPLYMHSSVHPHIIDSYLTSCDHVGHILGQLLDTLGITQVWCWKDASMKGVSYDGEHISSHCTLVLISSTHTGIHIPCCAHVGTCVAPLRNQQHDIVEGTTDQTFVLKTDELSVMLLFNNK